MLTTIKLQGSLGRLFIKEVQLNVSSVGEAIRALEANFPSFRAYFGSEGRSYRVITNLSKAISLQDVRIQSSELTDISIVPVLAGASGAGKVIMGALLIAAAYYLGPAGAELLSSGVATATMNVGISLLIGGIMELLFAPPEPDYAETDDNPSYNFNGAVNTTAQGNPVPVGYGRLMVGSAIIGAGIHTRNS